MKKVSKVEGVTQREGGEVLEEQEHKQEEKEYDDNEDDDGERQGSNTKNKRQTGRTNTIKQKENNKATF